MTPEHHLARRAIDLDLFGDDGLAPEKAVPVPARYEVLRHLGRGGTGDVYLGRDLTLGRDVALKYLRESRPALLERFRREARLTARLNDPVIVKIFEMGEIEGTPFIAMEYFPGGSLSGPSPDARGTVQVLREVAAALQHAHEQGIVHRDIKPSNILLDAGGRPHLTDFGIARDLFSSGDGTLSEAGQILGTPAFMAPEQARGELHAVDARCDVYSLGATLFYLLTGRWPFPAGNVVDVLHAVIHEPPPLPRSLKPGIPRAVEAIILQCLRKDPRERYASMTELIADFDRFLADRPVPSESLWFRRLVHRIAGKPADPPPPPPAEDPFLTLGMHVARELAEWDRDLYRLSRNVTRATPRLDAIIARLEEFLATRPDAAWARYYRGLALFRRGRLPEALEEMEAAINRAAAIPGAYFELGRLYLALYLRTHHEARKHLTREGYEYHVETARDGLTQAVLAFEEAERLDEHLPGWQKRYARAVRRLTEDDFAGCIAECDDILGEEPDVEDVWKLRGDALRLGGGDPLESYDRALEIRRSFTDAWLAKAEVFLDRGDLGEARRCAEQVLTLSPECTDAAVLLARLHHREFLGSGALEAWEEALRLLRGVLGQEPRHYEAHVAQAELWMSRARKEGSAAAWGSALDVLHSARELDGCQNRVGYLTASAQLERARLAERGGASPDDDLAAVLAACDRMFHDSRDPGPWKEIRAGAEELRRRRGG